MFATQFADMMQTVLHISKKREMTIQTPRVGTSQVDKIVVHMLRDLDGRLDKLQAEKEALEKELEGLRLNSKPQREVRAGEL